MIISAFWLQTLIYLATGLVALAPFILLALWVRDLRRGNIW